MTLGMYKIHLAERLATISLMTYIAMEWMLHVLVELLPMKDQNGSLDINCPNPDDMLSELKALAKDNIDVWIHAAAVLDYVIPDPVEGKIASLQGDLEIELKEGSKHIMELKSVCEDQPA